MPKFNWGKKYFKYSACLRGMPIYFCGSKPDDDILCYECLNEAVKYRPLFYKLYLLVKLWGVTTIDTVISNIRRLFSNNKSKIF